MRSSQKFKRRTRKIECRGGKKPWEEWQIILGRSERDPLPSNQLAGGCASLGGRRGWEGAVKAPTPWVGARVLGDEVGTAAGDSWWKLCWMGGSVRSQRRDRVTFSGQSKNWSSPVSIGAHWWPCPAPAPVLRARCPLRFSPLSLVLSTVARTLKTYLWNE